MITVQQMNKGRQRWYEVEGDERVEGMHLPSATTVISKLDKPALMPWYKKLVREQLNALVDAGPVIKEEIDNIVNNAGDIERDTAADIGTEVHKMIEQYNLTKEMPQPSLDSPSVKAFYAYLSWLKQEGMTINQSELAVYHSDLLYAGTIDSVAVDDEGKIVILDWKSGNRIYVETALQLSAYAMAYASMNGLEVTEIRAVAVRLNKETADFEMKEVNNIPQCHVMFLGLLNIYNNLKETKAVNVWK